MTHFLMLRPLKLLQKHINEQNLSHFQSYKTVFESSASTGDWKTLKDKFAGITQQLQNKFLSQFIDFHTRTNEIQRLQNPFPLTLSGSNAYVNGDK